MDNTTSGLQTTGTFAEAGDDQTIDPASPEQKSGSPDQGDFDLEASFEIS